MDNAHVPTPHPVSASHACPFSARRLQCHAPIRAQLAISVACRLSIYTAQLHVTNSQCNCTPQQACTAQHALHIMHDWSSPFGVEFLTTTGRAQCSSGTALCRLCTSYPRDTSCYSGRKYQQNCLFDRLSECKEPQFGHTEQEQAEDAEPVHWPCLHHLIWEAAHHQSGDALHA